MAILAFQKPDKVVMLENDSKYGKFEFRPLETGFGTTVGNALRRHEKSYYELVLRVELDDQHPN